MESALSFMVHNPSVYSPSNDIKSLHWTLCQSFLAHCHYVRCHIDTDRDRDTSIEYLSWVNPKVRHVMGNSETKRLWTRFACYSSTREAFSEEILFGSDRRSILMNSVGECSYGACSCPWLTSRFLSLHGLLEFLESGVQDLAQIPMK
jgi:hypothetical protein